MLNWDENQSGAYDYTSPEFASSTVHSFRAFDRSLITGGQNPEEVLGRPEIDVRPFFQKGDYDVHRHTPSTFGPWFVEAYPSMELPTRVAAAMMITSLLRVCCLETLFLDAWNDLLDGRGCRCCARGQNEFPLMLETPVADISIGRKLRSITAMATCNWSADVCSAHVGV
jgi:hypothetical protein